MDLNTHLSHTKPWEDLVLPQFSCGTHFLQSFALRFRTDVASMYFPLDSYPFVFFRHAIELKRCHVAFGVAGENIDSCSFRQFSQLIELVRYECAFALIDFKILFV